MKLIVERELLHIFAIDRNANDHQATRMDVVLFGNINNPYMTSRYTVENAIYLDP